MSKNKKLLHLRFIPMILGILLIPCISGFSAQEGSQKWNYFQFKAGQFFKYQIKSERGLSGWVSIKVEAGDEGALNIAIAGNWMGGWSETKALNQDMSALEFVYSFENFEIPNAVSNLLIANEDIIQKTVWQEGFNWAEGSKAITVGRSRTVAGVEGVVMVYTSKHFATQKSETRTYCVNSDLPLPLSVECPAANDTWTYELAEISGN